MTIMAGSGPAPNPQSRKQSGQQAHTWTDLPAAGYAGSIPEWPLPTVSDDELAMWVRYWRKPQASAWAAIDMTDEVALYVRSVLLGAAGEVKATTEARQWAVLLGLTPTAMLKNRWRVRGDDLADSRVSKEPAATRRRFTVVDDAVARA